MEDGGDFGENLKTNQKFHEFITCRGVLEQNKSEI